jgi:ABC-type multidrug transport system fused ATPase/permease subunit
VIFVLASALGGVGIAIYRGVDFAFICLAFFPFIMIITGVFGARVKVATMARVGAMKKLGGFIEESLTAIRLISAFANEDKAVEKFNFFAANVRKVAHK